MSDSSGVQPAEDDDGLRWEDTAAAAVAAVALEAAAGGAAAEADVATEDETEADFECSLKRVDSLTLALRALQAGGLQYSQDNAANSGNSLDSSRSGSDSQLDEDSRPAYKRASSLKLPRQQEDSSPDAVTKKAVRFADAMGLDLALVRDVFDLESPPEIPPQATRDLVLPPSDDEEQAEEGDDLLSFRDLQQQKPPPHAPVHLYLSPSFAQPGSAPNFNSRIAAQKVVLERAQFHQQAPTVGLPSFTQHAPAPATTVGGQVRGFVRVANLGFEKAVRVKASLDNWGNSFEVCADYVSGNGSSDQFAFTLGLPDWLRAGDRVAFCIAYSVNGETYWDNNFGDNYAFNCVPVGSGPRPGLDQAWTRYV
ncbi:hypothetical protein BOX15_Mlig019648g1 [Macrostomum lignano]|uniref:CBM21 domain-containing protein n=2 Tax=Macrostomum lignano TaxID=282301 RepID=A0A1I8GUF0_9PLAT|nr:hypothetical protein BOX15_Mlig011935g1 [Macrostomum lignano]PAA82734.1 hypothetical protein BOX15_Mlig019648g1 [Macrostomum lignano]